jgi:hypothetical protein
LDIPVLIAEKLISTITSGVASFLFRDAGSAISILRQREANMSDRIVERLNYARTLQVLAAAGAVVCTLLICIGNLPTIWAQTTTGRPEFDAASIKPVPCSGRCGGEARIERLKFTPGRISYRPEGTTARGIILEAFHLAAYQLPGGPSWIDSDRFAVEAVAKAPTDENQLRRMLQTLLAERFKLVLNRETKEIPVYSLTIGKQGARLREQKDGQPPPSSVREGLSLTTKMDHFIAFISVIGDVDRPILDKTGLA